MALIEFTAFVNGSVEDRKTGETFVIKSAESHRRQLEDGTYETTARTFRDVFVAKDADESSADWFRNAIHSESDMIEVKGYEMTRAREYDGRTIYDLVVYATEIKPHEVAAQSKRPAAKKTPAKRPSPTRR